MKIYCPRKGLLICKSLVRSKVEFVHSVTCNLPAYLDKKMQFFENRHLKRCSGLTPSTPVHILRVISGVLQVSERARRKSQSSWKKAGPGCTAKSTKRLQSLTSMPFYWNYRPVYKSAIYYELEKITSFISDCWKLNGSQTDIN